MILTVAVALISSEVIGEKHRGIQTFEPVFYPYIKLTVRQNVKRCFVAGVNTSDNKFKKAIWLTVNGSSSPCTPCLDVVTLFPSF